MPSRGSQARSGCGSELDTPTDFGAMDDRVNGRNVAFTKREQDDPCGSSKQANAAPDAGEV